MISIKQIRMLTNMSTGQINRCLNELKNKDLELFDEISKLLNTREETWSFAILLDYRTVR